MSLHLLSPKTSRQRRIRRHTRRRSLLLFEHLEDRRLLAADFQNPTLPADVNADGNVSPLDALIIINKLVEDGGGPLPTLDPGTQPEAYYDTSGDGNLTPMDVLLVINDLADGISDLRLLDSLAHGSNAIVLNYTGELSEASVVPESFFVSYCLHSNVCPDEAQPLAVIDAQLSEDKRQVLLTLSAQPAEATYIVQSPGVLDAEGEGLAPESVITTFDNSLPRVVGATSTSNTTVFVAFSEPMANNALDPQRYSIRQSLVNSEAGVLRVTAAAFLSPTDHSVVVLTTLPQNELSYTVNVVGVTDLTGSPMLQPLLSDPTRAAFLGTPPVASSLIDSDGDGLTDNDEQRGWIVTIQQLDGSFVTRDVTSDPFLNDSDGDGLTDDVEAALRLDPRDADTDDDILDDNREFNIVYSNPADQDTDDDGLDDGLERLFFHTSPLFADTDGDQFDDGMEVITQNRDPRIADLPRLQIDTGSVDLRLDVRFQEQTSKGTTTLDSKSVASTLTESQQADSSSQRSSTTQEMWEVGGEVCVGGACQTSGGLKGNFGFKASAKGGITSTEAKTYSNSSTKASQQEYATSLSTDKQVSAESVVTRVVEGATMAVEVNIVNTGDISFTLSNIEITALLQDPRDPTVFTPIATLFAASDAPISIGPLSPTRGPFRFEAKQAFPQLVESLMQNPRGVLFKVANYQIEDEHGRKFAYVEQDVNDRTAGLEIDYSGVLDSEKFRVATNSDFDADGNPVGLTLKGVMENVLGLAFVPEAEDKLLNPNVRADADRLDASYSTRMQTVDVTIKNADGSLSTVKEQRELLHRVRGVSSDLTNTDRKWWVLTPNGLITPTVRSSGSDFHSQQLFSDQSYVFKFVKDSDDDGLEADQEAFYQSIDSAADNLTSGKFGTDGKRIQIEGADTIPDSRDTDHDGIDDGDELYGLFVGNKNVGWTIHLEDGHDSYRTYSNPGRADTDLDGLTDCQELGLCSITVWANADGKPTLTQPQQAAAPLGTLWLVNPDAPGKVTIIDDGDPYDAVRELGFRQVGNTGWTVATGGFQNDYRHTTTRRAEWSFADLPDGMYRVSTTWQDSEANATQARYEISVGGTGTPVQVDVNQQTPPQDFSEQVVGWKNLGVFEVVGGKLKVALIGGQSNGRVLADAMRIEQLPTRPTDPSNPDTDNDGLTDAQEIVGFTYATLVGKANRSGGTLTLVPDFGSNSTATNPLSRDTDRDGLFDFQEIQLGTNPTIPDGDSVLDDDRDGLVNLVETTGWFVEVADASLGVAIIDDGDPGFHSSGGKALPDALSFNADYTELRSNVATWRFDNLPDGEYRVSATWHENPSSGTATFAVTNGKGLTVSRGVNQVFPPDDFSDAGVDWENVGKIAVTDKTLEVTLQCGQTSKDIITICLYPTIADAIRIERISTRVMSDPKQPDTDGDGLTDWEEFYGCRDINHDLNCDDVDKIFGSIDPRSSDTDGDNLTDREEVDGIDFPYDSEKPFRFTDPLDWDTDDDLRSDGDEVHVPWDVAVTRQAIEEVFSDPTRRDSDGDRLNDSEEFLLGSHPYKADTDDDGTLDNVEATRVTNLLAPDHLVTVTYHTIWVGKGGGDKADGDDGSPGDFQFELGVGVIADGQLSSQVVVNNEDLIVPVCTGTSSADTVCRRPSGTIQLNFTRPLSLAATLPNTSAHSFSFVVANTDLFVLEGEIREYDGSNDIDKDVQFIYGGFSDPNAVFTGDLLDIGTRALTFQFDQGGVTIEVTLHITIE